MPIIDIGMTQEEIQAALEPAPAGQYRVIYKGLVEDENGNVLYPTKKGGKMVRARFEIVSNDPTVHGKSIFYNGVIGSFSFAELCKVLPLMSGRGIDTEAGIGTELLADVTLEEYQDQNGETQKRNGIKKLMIG